VIRAILQHADRNVACESGAIVFGPVGGVGQVTLVYLVGRLQFGSLHPHRHSSIWSSRSVAARHARVNPFLSCSASGPIAATTASAPGRYTPIHTRKRYHVWYRR